MSLIDDWNKQIDSYYVKYGIHLLVLIIIAAVLLRVLFLEVDSMWIDETISASAAKGILENGIPLLKDGTWYPRAEIFHYMMAFFVLAFDGDYGARFISVVFGVLTVYLAFVFGKRFSDNKFLPYGFALVVALSSIEIIYSRQARFYQFFQFFYFFSLYFFYRVIIQKEFWRNKYFSYVILALSIIITINTQSMGFIIIPLFIGYYLLFNFERIRKEIKKNYWLFLLLIGIVSIAVIGFMIYRFSALIPLDGISRVLYYSGLYQEFFTKYLVVIIISIVGLILAFYDDWKKNLMISSYVLIPMIGLFFIKFFATRYSYFIFFIIFYYCVYAISRAKLSGILVILLIVIHLGVGFTISPIIYPNYDSSMPIADYKGAYSQLDTDLPLVTTWTPGANWYYGKADYWIKYSVDGTERDWMINPETGREKFANAQVVETINDLPEEFVLTVDEQALIKLDPMFDDFINNNCEIQYISFNIDVYECSN